MSKQKTYWVKETALYRIPAETAQEAAEKFTANQLTYMHDVQKKKWYVSTGRWTQRRLLDEEVPE